MGKKFRWDTKIYLKGRIVGGECCILFRTLVRFISLLKSLKNFNLNTLFQRKIEPSTWILPSWTLHDSVNKIDILLPKVQRNSFIFTFYNYTETTKSIRYVTKRTPTTTVKLVVGTFPFWHYRRLKTTILIVVSVGKSLKFHGTSKYFNLFILLSYI